MLTLRNVHKAFGTQVIFESASLQMNAGDRLALMGPNGAGKSTLFRLLLGQQEPDAGDVILRSDVTIGHLPQENSDFLGGTVVEETVAAAWDTLEDVRHSHDERRAAEAKKILMGLGFRVTDFDRPVENLSGGWRMRVAIARLLLQNPDVMLLDEPTNHLDMDSLLWFQDYLRKWKGTILLISHDRAFVNALVQGILDLRDHKLYRYPGDYEHFLSVREQETAALLAAYERQQKEIKDHEEFIARFRAQAAKAPQVQSRIKMLDKMERIELPPEVKKVKIRFPQPTRTGARVLTLKNASKSYGPVKVYENLDFELHRGQKIAFVGHNGAGKSTLLKVLAGVLPLDGGERVVGLNAEVGYFAQHRLDTLKSERTVEQEAMDTRRMNPDLFVRTVLGTFLFRGDSIYKKVGVLSGGEKSRLALVKLLLDPPNALFLDEPTTHLDMASVEALVQALKEYEGTLCFISHDLYFVNALADHVLHVEGGKVTLYPGNYEYFQRRISQKAEEGPEEEAKPAAAPRPTQAAAHHAPVKSSAEDRDKLKESQKSRDKKRRQLNAAVRELEADLLRLTTKQASIFVQSDYKELMKLDESIKRAEKELEEAKRELAKLAGS